MSPRSGVLAIGPGFCWLAHGFDDGTEGAAVFLDRRDDGLRGMVRKDACGWWVADAYGRRQDVPESVVDTMRGTAPYGMYLLAEQAELLTPKRHRRFVRGIPWTVACPDCGAEVLVA